MGVRGGERGARNSARRASGGRGRRGRIERDEGRTLEITLRSAILKMLRLVQ